MSGDGDEAQAPGSSRQAGPAIAAIAALSSTSDSSDSSSRDDDHKDQDVLERARRHKARGNARFQRKDFRKAVASYSRAIDLVLLEDAPSSSSSSAYCADRDEMEKDALATAYCNRAAAWLSCGEWRRALDDCDEVLRLGQSNSLTVKAFYRRGKAHEAFGDADSARRDFESALLLEPQNKLALEAVENYKSVLHRLVVLSKASPEVRSRQRKGL